jgi:hypothetical protein
MCLIFIDLQMAIVFRAQNTRPLLCGVLLPIRTVSVSVNSATKPSAQIQTLCRDWQLTQSQAAAFITLQERVPSTLEEYYRTLKASIPGITKKKLAVSMTRRALVWRSDADSFIRQYEELKQLLDLSDSSATCIALKWPRILTMEMATVKYRADSLIALMGSRDDTIHMLQIHPQLLTYESSTTLQKARHIMLLLKLDANQARTVFSRVPKLLSHSEDSVTQIYHMLQAKLFLEPRELNKRLLVAPQPLGLGPASTSDKIDYLMNTCNVEPHVIANNLVLLTFSLEKNMKPRYDIMMSKSGEINPIAFRYTKAHFLSTYDLTPSEYDQAIAKHSQSRDDEDD